MVEFFGVPTEYDDPCHSFSFTTSKGGVQLLYTLFDMEGAAYVSLARDGKKKSLITIQREGCSHVQVVRHSDGRTCLESGRPKHPVTDMGVAPVLWQGFRIFVDPDFEIELIEPRQERG